MGETTGRTRRILAGLAAVAVACGLSACGLSTFFPVVDESTPTGEKVDAALEPFYGQVLRWEQCGDLECATAVAPLDWDAPSGAEIELALIRQPARGDRIGSLLMNPGGPGVSGYDAVASSLDVATTAELQDRYDIVGFDPRGVGRSTAVDCLSAEELDRFLYTPARGIRGTTDWLTSQNEQTHRFGQSCLRNTGDLLANVDTASVARDLDMLRAALGEKRLAYLGYSYGAYLGTVYAGLFPDRVGRLVLDGPIDPSLTRSAVTLAQAKGFEAALRSYLDACIPAATCPFEGTADDALPIVREILDAVARNPIPSTDGRVLGVDTLLLAIAAPLYRQDTWPALDTVFTTVLAGQAEFALTVVDGYYGRSPEGEYSGNLPEAIRAVNCLDHAAQNNVEVMKEEARALSREAPHLGVYFAFDDVSCLSWPYRSELERVAITAPGAAPILVLGTTGDPSTPYAWAVAVASQLESGVLVTRTGEGHTAFNKGDACVDAAVEAYLVDGVAPPADVTCPA
ncbi:alpha/beta hydrolase [Agromyces bracchium]|uniref:Alpha/beta fold hydrolase n=1 Tax=Agromyces bracchium TaxID=88376 RepID=A0A6I3M7N1_9MICO|nr:alpha/beta hydrolase [Agromyces bracchium]MTH68981.1 alpha/beta fold hydrolase [Agromyces bracchium]